MIKNFRQFVNEAEGMDFEDLSRMVELGIISSEEAKAELRKQMKARIQPGTSPFDDVNYEALKASPTIQAVRLPEFQPFIDAGFEPKSSIQQIINGSLYIKRPFADVWQAGLVFFSQSGYIRREGGDRLQVIAKDIPGQGLDYYRTAFKLISDKYDLTTPNVNTKGASNLAATRGEAADRVRAELADLLPDDSLFTKHYIDHLVSKRKGPALAKSIEAIKQHPTLLPTYFDDTSKISLMISAAGHSGNANPIGVKFYTDVPLKLYYWSESELNRLVRNGWLDPDFGKPITVRPRQ